MKSLQQENSMEDESKAWYKQYSKNFGPRELARFGCVFIFWMFLGTALSLVFRFSELILLFLFIAFSFALVAIRWKPAYSLFRRILGNQNLPIEPMPKWRTKSGVQPREWWSYVPAIWWLLVELLLLYAVLRYISK